MYRVDFKSTRLRILLAMVILCAVLGGGTAIYLRHYNASVTLVGPDAAQSFKEIGILLRSPFLLERFIASSGLSSDPIGKAFREKMEGGSGDIRVTQEWTFSKADLRNVPDEIAQVLLKNHASRIAGVKISVAAKRPDVAIKMAQVAMQFVRSLLIEQGLRQSIADWRVLGARLPNLNSEILEAEWQLESLDRQIAGMAKLQDMERDAGSGPNTPGNSVQVQVGGAHAATFLPVNQQLVALRSQRVIDAEALKKKQAEYQRVRSISGFADQIEGLLNEGSSSSQILAKALQLVRPPREEDRSIAERQGADVIISRISALQSGYGETIFGPGDVFAVRMGPSLAQSVAIGGAIGILGWVVLIYIFLVWGPLIYSFRKTFSPDLQKQDRRPEFWP